jgi:hypothetical protein
VFGVFVHERVHRYFQDSLMLITQPAGAAHHMRYKNLLPP